MSSFAPVYRPSATQQSFLAREQKRERKRKRSAFDNRDSAERSASSDGEEDAPRVLYPVTKTDPYYVAGHPREKPLPGGNFPHAAVKEARKPQPPAEEELSRLKPPIYVPKIAQTDHSSSLKARHLDNLTSILHNCMQKDDWERASRAWGLILRTEIAGRGPDVRQHGRWTIGAEILMRRDQSAERIQTRRSSVESFSRNEEDVTNEASTSPLPVIKEESFKRAREYYERLILQHPHQQRTHHSIITALSIQPARFSLWVYHVQDKSRRDRQKISTSSDVSEVDINMSPGNSDRSNQSDLRRRVLQVRTQEYKEALDIARHLDELLVSPPYDSSHELLYTRAMVALWLFDMTSELSHMPHEDVRSRTSDDGEEDSTLMQTTTTQAHTERRRARRIFQKLLAANMELPAGVHTFLEEDEDDNDQ